MQRSHVSLFCIFFCTQMALTSCWLLIKTSLLLAARGVCPRPQQPAAHSAQCLLPTPNPAPCIHTITLTQLCAHLHCLPQGLLLAADSSHGQQRTCAARGVPRCAGCIESSAVSTVQLRSQTGMLPSRLRIAAYRKVSKDTGVVAHAPRCEGILLPQPLLQARSGARTARRGARQQQLLWLRQPALARWWRGGGLPRELQ
jgi:hypothetical protein